MVHSVISLAPPVTRHTHTHHHHHHHHHHSVLAKALLNGSLAAPYKVCLIKIIGDCCRCYFSAKNWGNVFTFVGWLELVCLSVCLSVCQQDYSNSCGPIFVKFYVWNSLMRNGVVDQGRIDYILGRILICIWIHFSIFQHGKIGYFLHSSNITHKHVDRFSRNLMGDEPRHWQFRFWDSFRISFFYFSNMERQGV